MRAVAVLCLLAAAIPALADPSPAYLVKDLTTTPITGLELTKIADVNGVAILVVNMPETGRELWRSDGTPAGTQLLKEIYPGTQGGINPEQFPFTDDYKLAGGTLFFPAFGPGVGTELWKTDGTAAGTVLVKDILPGGQSSDPTRLVAVGNSVFFQAYDGSNGTALWKSDGTSAGTVLVKDINTSTFETLDSIEDAVDVDGTLFFEGGGPDGFELWKSDGTAAGTLLVKDIRPGSNGANIASLVNVNGTAFFTASDGSAGLEVWKSDGTAAGTVLVKDIRPGSTGSTPPQSLTNLDGTLYFSAFDGVHGRELWKSDGTEAGTVMVKDIYPGLPTSDSEPWSRIVVSNGALYFRADDGVNGSALWTSDGTEAGTVMVVDIDPTTAHSTFPRDFVNVDDTLFFRATDVAHGVELWKSDGTAAGTALVADLVAGTGAPTFASFPNGISSFTGVNGSLFMGADVGSGTQLWRSDGSAAGTLALTDVTGTRSTLLNFLFPAPLTAVGSTVYFAHAEGSPGTELWRTDGTAAGTYLVRDIFVPGSSQPELLTNVNGTLYLTANDSPTGRELWKSDGTNDGTVLVHDILPGVVGSTPSGPLGSSGATTFFYADDGTHGRELWKTNGTSAGTALVKDIWPGVNGSVVPIAGVLPRELGSNVFFTASDGVSFVELWKSDGTEAGTVMVKDILASGSSAPQGLLVVDDLGLFFNAIDDVHGRELWKTDGTEAGTVLVKDIRPGTPSTSFSAAARMNGVLFMLLDDGAHGEELWRSDGTEAGTVLVKDIVPGAGSSAPDSLERVGDTMFFVANDGIHGRELWKTDGTEAGTVRVSDIAPGGGSSSPGNLTDIGSVVVFTANDGVSGNELWVSDGDPAGTRQVADIGSLGGSAPTDLTPAGPLLLFWATTNEFGNELYAVPTAVLTDADLDGLLDADERALGTDEFDADSDGDGLTDGAEVNTHGTNPLLADTDGDGFDDDDELAAGTNPLDPLSFPPSVPLFGVGAYGALAALLLATGRRRAR